MNAQKASVSERPLLDQKSGRSVQQAALVTTMPGSFGRSAQAVGASNERHFRPLAV